MKLLFRNMMCLRKLRVGKTQRREFISTAAAMLARAAWAETGRTSGVRLAGAARKQLGVTTGYDPKYAQMCYPGGDVARGTGVCADVVVRRLATGLG